ncbi:MAG TPA: M28 family peptidase [Parasegetibacter sp.]
MRQISLVLILACAAVMPALAQKNTLKGADKFGKTITAEDFKKHLYIIAGPEMEGRETATEGERKAAAYITDFFKSIGLPPGNNGSYFQPFPVYSDQFKSAAIEVNGVALEIDKDFAVPSSNYNATQYFSEVVYLNEGNFTDSDNDFKDIDVKGKLVLIRLVKSENGRVVGTRGNPNMKVAAAMQHGAAAVLLVQTGFPRPPAGGQGRPRIYINTFGKSVGPNTFTISESVADRIMGADWKLALEGKIAPKVYSANVMVEYQKTVNRMYANNILGYLEGTDKKDELLVISAHYDHIGMTENEINQGADDNGSGTVAVMKMAEAFMQAKKAGKGPRRSILFLLVSGEEKGLWGSAYYANHPVYPLEKTTVNLNIDMIGRIGNDYKAADSNNYIYVIGDDKLSSDLRPINEAANKRFVKLNLDYRYNGNDPNRFYYRSDHYNFAQKGVPAIFYFSGVHADYHRPSDTPDKINYPLAAKRAQLVFYTAWEMANRNEMLKRDRPLDLK